MILELFAATTKLSGFDMEERVEVCTTIELLQKYSNGVCVFFCIHQTVGFHSGCATDFRIPRDRSVRREHHERHFAAKLDNPMRQVCALEEGRTRRVQRGGS